jgi:hypothetical protein
LASKLKTAAEVAAAEAAAAKDAAADAEARRDAVAREAKSRCDAAEARCDAAVREAEERARDVVDAAAREEALLSVLRSAKASVAGEGGWVEEPRPVGVLPPEAPARGATDDAAVFFDATRDAHVTKSYANDPAAALRAAEETRAALAATRASLLNAFDARETQNRPRP